MTEYDKRIIKEFETDIVQMLCLYDTLSETAQSKLNKTFCETWNFQGYLQAARSVASSIVKQ